MLTTMTIVESTAITATDVADAISAVGGLVMLTGSGATITPDE